MAYILNLKMGIKLLRPYKAISLLVYALIIISCNSGTAQDNEREKYIFRYLNEVQKIKLNKDQYSTVCILNNGVCNCIGDPVKIINKLRPISDTVIVIQAKSNFISSVQFKNKVTILNDKDEKLGEYGLGNATHYFFILRDNKMAYWNYLDNNHVNEINKAIKKLE